MKALKIVSLLLVFVLALGVFVSCGAKQTEETTAPEAVDETTAAEADTSKGTLVMGTNAAFPP